MKVDRIGLGKINGGWRELDISFYCTSLITQSGSASQVNDRLEHS